jgi:hypothetical protein
LFRLEQTLHYIYFNRKNITIFIPEGINSIEYLLHREKIFTGTINYPEEHRKEKNEYLHNKILQSNKTIILIEVYVLLTSISDKP